MFKKMTLVMLITVSIGLALPKQVEAAYPDGASVGVALTGSFPFGAGLVLTGKFEPVPLVFGASINLAIGQASALVINLTSDWWGFRLPLGQVGDASVSMYLGPGASLDVSILLGGGTSVFDDTMSFGSADIGIRMPIGFSFLVKDTWEIYLEPFIGLSVLSLSHNFEDIAVRLFGFPLAKDSIFAPQALRIGSQFGFRYWF